MKPHVIRLLDEARKRRACEIISTADNNKVVEIKDYKANRSQQQHQLLWLWQTIIAHELGESKDDIHERHKERFLLPILIRDDENSAATAAALSEIERNGMETQAVFLRKRWIREATTTSLNTKQFTEYLQEIESHAASLGIMLPPPGGYGGDAA